MSEITNETLLEALLAWSKKMPGLSRTEILERPPISFRHIEADKKERSGVYLVYSEILPQDDDKDSFHLWLLPEGKEEVTVYEYDGKASHCEVSLDELEGYLNGLPRQFNIKIVSEWLEEEGYTEDDYPNPILSEGVFGEHPDITQYCTIEHYGEGDKFSQMIENGCDGEMAILYRDPSDWTRLLIRAKATNLRNHAERMNWLREHGKIPDSLA